MLAQGGVSQPLVWLLATASCDSAIFQNTIASGAILLVLPQLVLFGRLASVSATPACLGMVGAPRLEALLRFATQARPVMLYFQYWGGIRGPL